MNMRVSI
ncbi:hypothetical protein AZE42_13008 [Rhizopogon vesiculosus]|nr:hypothetical protein AZE42_13008 [Rhizopogon vesiculosus]